MPKPLSISESLFTKYREPDEVVGRDLPLPFALRRVFVSLRRAFLEELNQIVAQIKASLRQIIIGVALKASALTLLMISTVLLVSCVLTILMNGFPGGLPWNIPVWEALYITGITAGVVAFVLWGSSQRLGGRSRLSGEYPAPPGVAALSTDVSPSAGEGLRAAPVSNELPTLEATRGVASERPNVISHKLKDMAFFFDLLAPVAESLLIPLGGVAIRLVAKLFRSHPYLALLATVLAFLAVTRKFRGRKSGGAQKMTSPLRNIIFGR